MHKLICKLSVWPAGARRPLQTLALACLAAGFMTACGGDSGPTAPVAATDGVATEQKPVTLAPGKPCDAAQGADLPSRLNTELDCAP